MELWQVAPKEDQNGRETMTDGSRSKAFIAEEDENGVDHIHGCFHLVHLGVLRQPESTEEAATAPLDAVPLVVLLLLLPAALATDLEDAALLHLHLHLLFLHAWDVGFKDMNLRGLLSVDTGVGKGRGLAHESRAGLGNGAEGVEGEALEGIPEIKGERVEDVAAPNDRHFILILLASSGKLARDFESFLKLLLLGVLLEIQAEWWTGREEAVAILVVRK